VCRRCYLLRGRYGLAVLIGVWALHCPQDIPLVLFHLGPATGTRAWILELACIHRSVWTFDSHWPRVSSLYLRHCATSFVIHSEAGDEKAEAVRGLASRLVNSMRSVAVAHQTAEVTGVSQKCPVVIRTVTAVCVSSSVGARLMCIRCVTCWCWC
jgi:hypothetical protein